MAPTSTWRFMDNRIGAPPFAGFAIQSDGKVCISNYTTNGIIEHRFDNEREAYIWYVNLLLNKLGPCWQVYNILEESWQKMK